MAKSKNKNTEGLDFIENPDVLVNKVEVFFAENRNQKIVAIVGGVVIAIILAFLGDSYVNNGKNAEAQEEMFQAVYYFESDSLGQALNGDGNSYGFIDIVSLYTGTAAANLSSFYIGVTYMKLKDFSNAIKYLKDFSGDDYLIQTRAYALIGDAYMELDDFQNASEYFEKAANYKNNKEFSPTYLAKYALSLELKGDLKGAITIYDKIIKEYNQSTLFQEATKQKARLEGLNTK